MCLTARQAVVQWDHPLDDDTVPLDLDDDIAPLGSPSLFSADPFGIRDGDRTNHLYMVGKTGTGTSTMLANLMVRDIAHRAEL